MKSPLRLLALLTLCSALLCCGQKGGLTRPEQAAASASFQA